MIHWLKRIEPDAIVALGIVVYCAGLAYDTAFAGIPYPDPTPELEASYQRHAGIARPVELMGIIIALLGLVLLGLVGAWSRIKQRWLASIHKSEKSGNIDGVIG